MFTARLQSAGNKPQNLVGYRYFDPLKLEGNDYSKWALLVKKLTDPDGDLIDRIDQFVAGLHELIKKKVLNNKIAFSALSRSVTTLLLMLSDPTQHAIIKTQEFNRTLKAFGKTLMPSEPLTGKEYKRVQDFLNELTTMLKAMDLTPRDMIDVQSFIWVGDEKTYQASEQYWLLGASWDGEDKTSAFVAEGRWENGYEEKLLDRVKKVRKGDRVAIKSSYTKKLDLPFNSRGKTISCMDIKARGVVKENPGDGHHLKIDWESDFEPRTIYFYTYRSTIDLIDTAKYKGTTIAWVFGDVDQEVEWLEEQSKLKNQETFTPVTNIVGSLNRILYGPPGTGKTFHTVDEALSILDAEFLQANFNNRTALKERFDELVADEDIRFVTFHQSFCYEDFVEGLRPVPDAAGNLTYKVEPGVFKSLCDSAAVADLAFVEAQASEGVTSAEAVKLEAGEALGDTYRIGKVTPDVVIVEKKGGTSVPFTWELLNELTELVRSGSITLDDIRTKNVFKKAPNLKLEKYLVNGYETILHRLIALTLNASATSGASASDVLRKGRPKVLIIDESITGERYRVEEIGLFGDAIAFASSTIGDGGLAALTVTLQDDIDDAGDGVRTILSSSAVAQHFDAFDGAQRDSVEIDARTATSDRTVVVKQGILMQSFAVDQHQHLIRVETAQGERRRMVSAVCNAGAGCVEARNQHRQGADQFGLSGGMQLRRSDDVDRHLGIERIAIAATRADSSLGLGFHLQKLLQRAIVVIVGFLHGLFSGEYGSDGAG